MGSATRTVFFENTHLDSILGTWFTGVESKDLEHYTFIAGLSNTVDLTQVSWWNLSLPGTFTYYAGVGESGKGWAGLGGLLYQLNDQIGVGISYGDPKTAPSGLTEGLHDPLQLESGLGAHTFKLGKQFGLKIHIQW